MNITKTVGALAVVGIVAVGGAAFTAGGLTNTTDQATQFIGGTISQSVSGARLDGIEYIYDEDETDPLLRTVTGINLTFLDPTEGRAVTVATNPGATTPFVCTPVVVAGPANDLEVQCVGVASATLTNIAVKVVNA